MMASNKSRLFWALVIGTLMVAVCMLLNKSVQTALFFDSCNVKDFGAFGDGVTDDTRAIQNTIDFASENNKNVFFPEGEYLISSVLFNAEHPKLSSALMCYEGQIIRGKKATLLIGDEAVTHTIFTYNPDSAGAYSGCRNVVIEGITFDGNERLSNKITHVNISHAENVTVKDCCFVNSRKWHSIEVNSSKEVSINNCVFQNNSNSEDIQLDAAIGEGNLGQSDGTVCHDVVIEKNAFNVNNNPAVGNHTDAAHYHVIIRGNSFSGDAGERGYISFTESAYDIQEEDNVIIDMSEE